MNQGLKDDQTVQPDGSRSRPFHIHDVKTIPLNNVITRSGSVTELFRTDWTEIGIAPQHVILATMNPGGVTDWHRHSKQTDHLIAISGNIKLCLWDSRQDSPTYNAVDVIRMGLTRPLIAIVPPGVWHGLRNESGLTAQYVNINDVPYNHSDPDNFRLSADTTTIPIEL
jgi:dTDP-4-dehydrorhamnose 3,5-epimerase